MLESDQDGAPGRGKIIQRHKREMKAGQQGDWSPKIAIYLNGGGIGILA